MAENERPSGLAIINAIRAEREANRASDRSNLNDTLVKSSLWKENTLQQVDATLTGENDDSASQAERRQAATLRRRDEEIERLQQTIVKLEAENARLTAEHQDELDSHRIELAEFQAAYDQFQQQSDQLMNELDEDNERLRLECKLNNKRSML